MRKLRFIIQFLTLFIFLCTERDPISPRDNSYDQGGENWKYHYKPTVTAKVDTIWSDYDHKNSSGSIFIHATVKDLDLPHDTLQFKLYYGLKRSELDSLDAGTDSLIFLKGIKRGTAYYCSLLVADAWDSSSYLIKNFTTPKEIPPHAPDAKIYYVNGSSFYGDMEIGWPIVSDAKKYNVYKADSIDGEFKLVSTVLPDSSLSKLFYWEAPKDFTPRYFFVTSVNKYGECRSIDTLERHVIYSELKIPVIDSVIEENNCLKIMWNSYKDASVYQLYRGLSSKGPFEFLTTVNDTFYNDTVSTGSKYYYRLTYLDSINRSSFPGIVNDGVIMDVDTLQLNDIESFHDHLNISWNAFAGTKAYVVFRSTYSCDSNSFVPINMVTGTSYIDSVEDTSYYYYRVAPIDSSSRFILQSSCKGSRLKRLGTPFLTASNGSYNTRIYLNWNPVDGTNSYIIYRSEIDSSLKPIDTLTAKDTSYCDTVEGGYYYAVSACNKIELGNMSNHAYGSTTQRAFIDSILPLLLPYRKIQKLEFEHSETSSSNPISDLKSEVYWEFFNDSLKNLIRVIESRKKMIRISGTDTVHLSDTSLSKFDTVDIVKKRTIIEITIRGENDTAFSHNIYWKYILHSIDTASAKFSPETDTTVTFGEDKFSALKSEFIVSGDKQGYIVMNKDTGPFTILRHIGGVDNLFTLKKFY
jgi:hypothetical protein